MRFTIFLLLLFYACDNSIEEKDEAGVPSTIVVASESDPGTHIEVNAYFYDYDSGLEVAGVTLSWKDASIDYEIESDEDGHVYIIGFRPGEHKLSISVDGYEDAWYCLNLANVQVDSYKKDVRIPLVSNQESIETTLYIRNNGFDVPIAETDFEIRFASFYLDNGDSMEFKRKRISGHTVNGVVSVSNVPNLYNYLRAYYRDGDDIIGFYVYGRPSIFPSASVRSKVVDRLKLLSTSVSTNEGIGLTNVDPAADIQVNFSAMVALDSWVVVKLLKMSDGTTISANLTWSNLNQVATLDPSSDLESDTHYLLLLDNIYPINGEYWSYSIQCVYILFKTL